MLIVVEYIWCLYNEHMIKSHCNMCGYHESLQALPYSTQV